MDDTLYPEHDYVLSGFRAVANWFEQHHNTPSDKSYAILQTMFEDGIRGNTFNLWLDKIGIQPDTQLIQDCIKVYRDHVPTITPYYDVIPTLESICPDYQIGLVSDGYLEVQKRKFQSLGLSKYFDAVVFSDEWGRDSWKPSTIPFQAVVEQLDIEAEQSIYIGDNPTKDFLGANQLGIYTIWIQRETGEYTNQEPSSKVHKPNIIIKSLYKIRQTLLASVAK